MPMVKDEETSTGRAETLLTRSGVAQLLGVSPTTVTRWARENRLPCRLTLGGHHRFERSVVEAIRDGLLQSGPIGPRPGRRDKLKEE